MLEGGGGRRAAGHPVVAVNSALQRARAALVARGVSSAARARPVDGAQQDLWPAYLPTFSATRCRPLMALLHEDARQSSVRRWKGGGCEAARGSTNALGSGLPCKGSRLVPPRWKPTRYRRLPSTRPGSGGALVPWALVVVEVADGRIAGWTSFLDAARLFPLLACRLSLRRRSSRRSSSLLGSGLRDSGGIPMSFAVAAS